MSKVLEHTGAADGSQSADAATVHDVRRPVRIWTVFGLYLVLAVLVWGRAWLHPATVTSCGCSDPGIVAWFLAWPAHAFVHGLDPFYSSTMFHPAGVNLLANTSELIFGVPLAPVTWLFGPVATLNVASTLTPALSALSMYWLLTRWVRWTPSAVIGGLVYGFSPFEISGLAVAHLNLAILIFLPLVIGLIDDLLVRQRGRPVRVGIALGVVMVLQFFSGTETAAMAAICIVGALILLLVYALAGYHREIAPRVRRALPGFASAAVVVVALLAYPAWFAVAGPAHLSGQVWETVEPAGVAGSTPTNFLSSGTTPGTLYLNGRSGYDGPPLPAPEYLGLGILVVIAIGVLIWRRDRRLWFFGPFGFMSFVLSLGFDSTSVWVPWRILAKIPIVKNIFPQRFVPFVILSAAVMLAIVLDRGRAGFERNLAQRPGFSAHDARVAAIVGALVVGVIAIAPVAQAEASVLPLATNPVKVPRWFTQRAAHLPPRQVILGYPFPGLVPGPVLLWQAIQGWPYAVAGGGGPQGLASRFGNLEPGYQALQTVSWTVAPTTDASATTVRAVRQALRSWSVTLVVIPERRSVPQSERGRAVPQAVALITAVLGRMPIQEDQVLVWRHVQSPAKPVALGGSGFGRCASMGEGTGVSLLPVSRCVLETGRVLR